MKGVVEVYLARLGIESVGFAPVQRPLFHRGRSACVLANGKEIGCLGELSGSSYQAFDLKPMVIVCEMDAESLAGMMEFSVQFQGLPLFPGCSRDIAIVVDEETTYEEVVSALGKKRPKILESIELFDVYRGEQIPPGKKSMAFSLKYRSKHGTLTDEEVEAAHSAIKLGLIRELACEIREGKGG